MTQINAYLTFNDNCREAMNFYKDCFGGELVLQTVGETPAATHMPVATHQKIMHSKLTRDGLILMGSEMAREKLVNGNTISLCINCSSEEEVNIFFSKLSTEGKVIDPLKQQFWGAIFGAVIDKYGIIWLLNYDLNPNK